MTNRYETTAEELAGVEKIRAIANLQREIKAIDDLHKRSRQLNHLAKMVRPANSSDFYNPPAHSVSAKVGRLFMKHRTAGGNVGPAQEIELTDAERKEFQEWCEEKAKKLEAEAEEREFKMAERGIKK